MRNKQKTILITGATGLVGSYLLKMLLENGDHVYALTRTKDNKSAAERVMETLKFWDENIAAEKAKNLKVLDGDVVKENLGLNGNDVSLLVDELEEIYHCAAVTQFNWLIDDIRKQNVAGTQNVLELASECQATSSFKKVNYLSTAYVCGDHKGEFREDDLDVGQDFPTTYVQSKFEAEKLVLEYRNKGLWIDIYRPPLVVGESTSGKTFTFLQSVYQLFHMLSLDIFDRFPGKGMSVNIEFIDLLCNAIYAISEKTADKNKNYHPFHPNPIPFERLINISSNFVGLKDLKLIPHEDLDYINLTPTQKMLLKKNILLFNGNVRLDSKKTNNILMQYGFEFPKLNDNMFVELLKYCSEKGFLKKSYERIPYQ